MPSLALQPCWASLNYLWCIYPSGPEQQCGSFSVHVQHHVQVLGEQMKGLEVKGHLESHEFMIRTFEWRLHLGNALSCLLLPRDSDAINRFLLGTGQLAGADGMSLLRAW